MLWQGLMCAQLCCVNVIEMSRLKTTGSLSRLSSLLSPLLLPPYLLSLSRAHVIGTSRLKTTDTTPRVIFLPRYVDLLLTQPLILATIGVLSKADTSVLVSLVGYDILMVSLE
jgi:bacteriorhodopsin